jgi:hypothetical protein
LATPTLSSADVAERSAAFADLAAMNKDRIATTTAMIASASVIMALPSDRKSQQCTNYGSDQYERADDSERRRLGGFRKSSVESSDGLAAEF